VGRQLRSGGQIGYESFKNVFNGTTDGLVAIQGGAHGVSLAPGVKWNIWREVLLTGNVLLSLSNNGLQSNIVAVAGMDVSF